MGHEYLPSPKRWCALVALVALLFTLVPQLVAAQSPTTFTASAQAVEDGRRINLDGRLLSGEAPVGRVDVHVTLGALSIGSTRTNAHGEFRLNFSVPDALRAGVQSVGLRFDGDGQFAPASSTLPVVMRGDAASMPAPASPMAPDAAEPVAPPADLRPATALSLSVTPENPRPGDFLTLTGRLTVADSGVPKGRIEVTFGGRASADSLTYTDDTGRFTTYLEVPAEQPQGRARIEVHFAATAAHLASAGTVAVTVREPLPEPSETPSTSPSAEPETVPDAQHQTIRTATSTTAPTTPMATTSSPTPIGQEDGGTVATVVNPTSGFLVALAAVGGSSLLVAVALLIRRVGRSPDDDVIPGFLSEAGGLWDDEPEAAVPDLEPHQPEPAPRPRRGLPTD